MLPDQVSNPGPLTYESGALPTVLRGPAFSVLDMWHATNLCHATRDLHGDACFITCHAACCRVNCFEKSVERFKC